jgi:Protein of unknown function (DUF1131)
MLALIAPASHGQSRPFLVTSVGIGGITAQTPYTVEAVSAGVGGLPVKPIKLHFEGIPIPALEATRDGKRVLLAFRREGGIHVGRAVAYAPESVTATGAAIGMPMARIYAGLPHPGCRNGLDQEAGLVFCPAADLENIRYAFRCNYPTRDDALPPAAVLARCPLERIIWIAPD